MTLNYISNKIFSLESLNKSTSPLPLEQQEQQQQQIIILRLIFIYCQVRKQENKVCTVYTGSIVPKHKCLDDDAIVLLDQKQFMQLSACK